MDREKTRMSNHRNGVDRSVSLTCKEVAEIFLETRCRVCGDKASGVHYGVESCEGCKGFYRRTSSRGLQYSPCSYQGNCEVNRSTRNRCQSCRYEKCLRVGMSINAVKFGRIPHMQKQIKFAERYAEWRKKNQDDDASFKRLQPKSEMTNIEENGCAAGAKKAKVHCTDQQASRRISKYDPIRKIPPRKNLSDHKHSETLTNDIYATRQTMALTDYIHTFNKSTMAATGNSSIYHRYPCAPIFLGMSAVQLPVSYLEDAHSSGSSTYLPDNNNELDCYGNRDWVFKENVARSESDSLCGDLTVEELTDVVHRAYERTIMEFVSRHGCESPGASSGSSDPTVKAIVNFAKEIPGFSTLPSPDKVILLKGSVSEVCYILHALDCGTTVNLVIIEDLAGHIEASKKGTWISTLNHFSETFSAMGLKPQQVGLFIAIVITSSGRAGVTDQKKIQNIHNRLLIALSTELQVSKGEEELLTYSNLLLMIPKLRSLTYLSLYSVV